MPLDAIRHLNDLVQALSQDKRPLAFLAGAGCPVSVPAAGSSSPLIPAIAGLTTEVTSRIASGAHNDSLKLIVDQLKSDGISAPNIEHILTRLRGLSQVAGAGDVRGLKASQLDALDTAICDAIAAVIDCELPAGSSGYVDVATWALSTNRAYPIEIFTTNYDLLFEQALERVNVPYFDGFVGSDKAFFDLHTVEEEILPIRWVRLWKLHGSLNWYSDGGDIVRTAKPLKGKPRVIHPSHLKYDESRKLPYLAMADRMRAFLRQPAATLVVIGYSFGDQHINASLIDGLRSNPTATAFGLLFGNMASNPQARPLAESRNNLCLLAEDSAVIGGKFELWASVQTSSPPVTSNALIWDLISGSSPASYQPKLLLGNFKMLGAACRELVGQSGGRANLSWNNSGRSRLDRKHRT